MEDDKPFEEALELVELEPLQKAIIKQRYLPLLKGLRMQTLRLAIFFHTSRYIITVGSLIVPALLSIQNSGSPTVDQRTYWATWVISLMVTISNGLMTLFKMDKHYFHLHTVREQLVSDGWQYLELTGKYSGFHTPDIRATHLNQFVFFCHSIEKIRMKQIQEEYYKVQDNHGQQATAAGQAALMLPPTPSEVDLSKIPPAIKTALQQLSQVSSGNGLLAKAGDKEAWAEGNTEIVENGPTKSLPV
jgi:hypothetical protein